MQNIGLNSQVNVKAIFPVYNRKYGVGYACQSILDAMYDENPACRLFCIACDAENKKNYHKLTLPTWLKSLGYKFFSSTTLVDFTEWKYSRSLQKHDVAYVWPGTSLELIKAIKSKGHIVVTENINTHQATSKAILDAEYTRLGLALTHGIQSQNIEEENAKLALVDFVFSPSPEVSKSLRAASICDSRIIQSSYGMDESDVVPYETIRSISQHEGKLVALFVGRIGVRKGAHLLLKYWVEAGVNGVLKLVGNIEQDAHHIIEPYLKYPGIEYVPFTNDLQSLYRQADVFIFPSLEEGSPLVTYLALGAGLPILASPMGGGGVVEHDKEGLVINPHDGKSWVEAIRALFVDSNMRKRLSENAWAKAPHYFWPKVGLKRYHDMISSIHKIQNGS